MRWTMLLAMGVLGCQPLPAGDGPDGTVGPTSPGPGVDTGQPLPTTDPSTPYVMTGFSFVHPQVAGMPRPGRFVPLDDDLAYLQEQGIRLLVSLPLDPISSDDAAPFDLTVLHLPIEDFQPPALDQQFELVEAVTAALERDESVGVHCTAGLGRTGTMIATWFVSTGMDAVSAIDEVRRLRPGSIETAEQEAAVASFEAAWTGTAAR